MKFMRGKHLIFTLLLALLALGLNGCGGGGDDNTVVDPYKGNTSAATLTDSNKDDFAIAALDGGASASVLNPYGLSENTAPAPKKAQRASLMSMLAEQIKNNVLATQAGSNPTFSGNSVTPSAIADQQGTCPGHNGSMSVSDNSNGGTINITMTYNNLCMGDLATGSEFTLSGQIAISGSFTQTGTGSITIAFKNFQMTLETATAKYTDSFSGSMTLTLENNVITGIKYTTVFSSDGKVYKVENLSVVKTANTLTISGKFYHPVHGYVDIKTTEPFDLISGSNPPQYCSGSLQISGAGGVIDFTANADCTKYEVCFTPTGEIQSCVANKTWP